MNQLIVDILSLNEKMNFQVIITCLVIYILIFWGAVCTWVYYDVKKRYESKYLRYAIVALVFIFSFPALIFYLVLRKTNSEVEPEIDHPHYEVESVNIPTIPIADLTDNGEVKFKLELSIVPVNSLNIHKPSDDIVQADSIKIKLVEYMNKAVNSESEIDRRIKGQVQKLLGLIKKKNKQINNFS